MAFPCCMGLTTGARLAAFVSLIVSLGVIAASGWLLHSTMELQNRADKRLLDSAGNFWSSIGGNEVTRVDPNKDLRIKLWCSGAVLGAAVLQCFTSLLLLLCVSCKAGHSTARLYVFINFFVLLAIVGALGCFLSTETYEAGNTDEDNQVKIFMGVAGLDFLLLIYLLLVAGFFIRS